MILVIGSSSGLGRSIFEQSANAGMKVLGVSRYSDDSILLRHKEMSCAIQQDLLEMHSQSEFDDFFESINIESINQLFIVIGGGYGINEVVPSYEDLSLLLKLNLLIPSSCFSLIKSKIT